MLNIKQAFSRIFGLFDGIREINDRYKTPRLKMTPLVRFSMFFLRVYLIFMIGILLYKFIAVALGH